MVNFCFRFEITTSQILAQPNHIHIDDHPQKVFQCHNMLSHFETLDPCRNADHAQLEQNSGKSTLLEEKRFVDSR